MTAFLERDISIQEEIIPEKHNKRNKRTMLISDTRQDKKLS